MMKTTKCLEHKKLSILKQFNSEMISILDLFLPHQQQQQQQQQKQQQN